MECHLAQRSERLDPTAIHLTWLKHLYICLPLVFMLFLLSCPIFRASRRLSTWVHSGEHRLIGFVCQPQHHTDHRCVWGVRERHQVSYTTSPLLYPSLCHSVFIFTSLKVSSQHHLSQYLLPPPPLHSFSPHLSRLSKLLETIMTQKANKTIIFVETKRRVDEITRKLRYEGCVHCCL